VPATLHKPPAKCKTQQWEITSGVIFRRLSGEAVWPTDQEKSRRESPTALTQRILADPTPDIVFAMLQKYQDVERLAKGGEKIAMTVARKEKKPG